MNARPEAWSELYLDQSNARTLPENYSGAVLVWDIDKTYLDTRFSTWRGLVAIPFEFAIDKQSIPGAVPTLRALRRGPGSESELVPLFFISGSPPQLRRVIERRMTLDGVHFDGITFKDQLGLLLHGRPADLRRQIGYKLAALLLYRQRVPQAARWWMFGDDVEADAEVFALFGEVCAGLRGRELEARLAFHSVAPSDRPAIVALADNLPFGDDPVAAIFVHLERRSDPASFTDPRVVATRSYLQTILVLAERGQVRAEAVGAVARDLRLRGGAESTLAEHLVDAQVRLGISPELADLAKRS